MATEQEKILDLLAKAEDTGIANITEKHGFTNNKRVFDINLLAANKDLANITIVVSRNGKVAFFEQVEAKRPGEDLVAPKRIDPVTSKVIAEDLHIPNAALQPERKPFSVGSFIESSSQIQSGETQTNEPETPSPKLK